MFHSSIWGVWIFVGGVLKNLGAKSFKGPVATELVTKRHLLQKLHYQTMPNSSKWEQHLFWSFLVEMTFSMTANISIPLHKGDFYETRLPTGWLLFTLLAVHTYNLSSKLVTQTHQLHYQLQERHFPTLFTIRSCEKTAVALKLSNVTFAGFFASTAKI